MCHTLIAAGVLLLAAGVARGQEAPAPDSGACRVFLKTGYVVEGQLISSSDQGLTLRIRGHEFRYRADQIDHLEAGKLTSGIEKPKASALGAPRAAVKTLKPPAIDPVVRERVDRILGQMQSVSVVEREVLARDLARRSGIGAYLASQLEHLKDDVLPYVGRVLWDLQEADAAPYLLAALDSDRPAVVTQALLLSGRLDNSLSAMNIRRFLGDRRPRVRAAAIEALRAVGDDRSLPDIAQWMTADESYVRAAAINATFDLARKSGRMDLAGEALREAMDRATGPALEDLIEAAGHFGGAGVVGSVVRHLRRGDPALRAKAAAALGFLQDPASLEAINQRLTIEDSVPVLIQLVRATGAFKSSQSVEPLIFLLRSPEPDLVKESVRMLKQLTQQDFGSSYSDWIAWWDQAKPR
ncbi:MAG TPA: HEAT repeat domain-containing protein [Planctomycetota bacterium]|nr:HEAT repeat domain-containing protein [Planctomycetota bacterium]